MRIIQKHKNALFDETLNRLLDTKVIMFEMLMLSLSIRKSSYKATILKLKR